MTKAKWYKRLWWSFLKLFRVPVNIVIAEDPKEIRTSVFTKGYSSIAGVDVRVFFKGTQLAFLQGISFDTIQMKGTALVILFDSAREIQKTLLCGPGRLFMQAANEYGKLAVLFDGIVEFKGEQWGISIDDIVTEKTLPFDIIENECPVSLHVEGRCNRCGMRDDSCYCPNEEELPADYKCFCWECNFEKKETNGE